MKWGGVEGLWTEERHHLTHVMKESPCQGGGGGEWRQGEGWEVVEVIQGRDDGGLARMVAVEAVRNISTSDIF